MPKMFAKITILFIFSRVTSAQINGEFWWLNDKVVKLHGVEPPPAKFEDVSIFDTDESDKVLFVNNNNITLNDKTESELPALLAFDYNNTANGTKKPLSEKITFRDNAIFDNNIINKVVFPSDIFTQNNEHTNTNELPVLLENENNINKSFDKLTFKENQEVTHVSKDICTFMDINDCIHRNGIIYNHSKRVSSKRALFNPKFVCCILPLSARPSSIFSFPDSPFRRYKRSSSKEDISRTLKQRNALLLFKYKLQSHRPKPTASAAKVTDKIVTDDDYIDPYSNIKNSNFKRPNLQHGPHYPPQTQQGNSEDYIEDYIVELPRPGLGSLYSDDAQRPWTFPNTDIKGTYDTDVSDEDDEHLIGYSTIHGQRVTKTKSPIVGRPLQLTTSTSEEFVHDDESQTVSFQSNPDFHIMQGFKLLNLVRNKNRIYTNNGKKLTTERTVVSDSVESTSGPIIADLSTESDYDLDLDANKQVYKECGKGKDFKDGYTDDGQFSESKNESHPWLALVVLTRTPHNILCYATLVHPRAAITVADCVYGKPPGAITVIAGHRSRNENGNARGQQRMATARLHTLYKPRRLTHNLAILHWKRPLRLGVTTQPACLTEPKIDDYCQLIGWSRNDQGTSRRLQWQQATVLDPEECSERISLDNRRIKLPTDIFCTSTDTRESFVDVGGPLICNRNGRQSIAGVTVWNDRATVVTTSLRDWTIRTIATLQLN